MAQILTDEPASRAAINAAGAEGQALVAQAGEIEGHFTTLGASVKDGGIAAALDRLKGEAAGWIRSAGTTINAKAAVVDGVLNGAKAMERQHAESVNMHAKRGRGW